MQIFFQKLSLIIGGCLIMLAACAPTSSSSNDEAALRALDQSYAQEWMEGDADGMMELFTDDATLVPHHGDTPIKGRAAIRDNWFNPEYSPTIVPEFSRENLEVFVDGNVGMVRSRTRLTWRYEGVTTTIPDGNSVMIAVRTDQGWKIRMLVWNDDPADWIRTEIAD